MKSAFSLDKIGWFIFFFSIIIYQVSYINLDNMTEQGHYYSSDMEPEYSQFKDLLNFGQMGGIIGLCIVGYDGYKTINPSEDETN